MLFRNKQKHCCACCIHATELNEENVLCDKHGKVDVAHSCWKFSYDPCKRVPVKAKAPDFTKYDSDDFSL